MGMPEREDALPVWVGAVAAALFLVHAANYLYFFVDDEAIPYVYAQNVLHGKGLSYSVLEGRIEGYSDFLHVGLSTLILAVTHAARLPKVSVFFVGKALSLLCGLAIVLMIWEILRRSRTERSGTIAGLGALALAGPLALWGRVMHWLPLHLARAIARRGSTSGADPAMYTVVSGVALVLAFYAFAGALVWHFAGPWWAVAFLVTLPVSAGWDFRLRDRAARARRRIRAFRHFRRQPELQRELLRQLAAAREEAVALERDVQTLVSGA